MSHLNKKEKTGKRRAFEVEEGSDEDILIDENPGSDNDEDYRKSKQGKNLKTLSGNSNFQTLRQMRLMKRYNNKINR